jgi:hypothetical protein
LEPVEHRILFGRRAVQRHLNQWDDGH